MREREQTLDLEDADIVGSESAQPRRSTPPPPPTKSGRLPRAAAPVVRVTQTLAPPALAPRVSSAPVSSAPVSSAPVSSARHHGSTPPAPPSSGALPPGNVVPSAPLRSGAPSGGVRPPPASALSIRGSIPDPTDILFDAMSELHLATTSWEAAGICARALALALGARTVIVHLHDVERGEIRAIGAHGEGQADIIGSVESAEDDVVASAVICNGKNATLHFDGELPRFAPKRLHAIGAPHAVVAVPVLSWGRCVAIVEVVDAEERFAARIGNGALYVAERFAAFLRHQAG